MDSDAPTTETLIESYLAQHESTKAAEEVARDARDKLHTQRKRLLDRLKTAGSACYKGTLYTAKEHDRMSGRAPGGDPGHYLETNDVQNILQEPNNAPDGRTTGQSDA